MKLIKKIKDEGISLKVVYKFLLTMTIIAAGILLYATWHTSDTYQRLSNATDDYIELQKATYELMDASDNLTENVQRFSVDGDMKFLEDYFTETLKKQRRENAISVMSQNSNSAAALSNLQMALDESMNLMNREYYAMKLVIEAKGHQDYPDILKTVQLSPEDAVLSAPEKMNLAQKMVMDDKYYEQKALIRENLKKSREELENLTHGAQQSSSNEMKMGLKMVRVLIILQTIGILIMILLTAHLGINPVLQAVENIQKNNPLPVIGAIEFRHLANTYNKMYDVYKSSIEHLNYKASHDELTGVYNRAGYELILSALDIHTTYFVLFDADNFKEINDSCGHETGDKVLMKIAESIRHNFRSDDYIFRIGGDEFMVFMVHTDESQRRLVSSKVMQINKELADTSDGIPSTSVSSGIIHGSKIGSTKEVLRCADQALYKTKHNGKQGFSFYDGENNVPENNV